MAFPCILGFKKAPFFPLFFLLFSPYISFLLSNKSDSDEGHLIDYGRGSSDLFERGLVDGYGQKKNRVQMMKREKEEEKKTEKMIRNTVQEWQKNLGQR